jgi:Purple acid Phosphatase, N-terminal domain
MNGLLRKLPMIVILGCLLYSTQALTQVSPTTEKAAKARITQGPEIERNDFVVIIRWTSNNPGGSPEHFGVVHYGVSPQDLSQTAKSPIRLNPGHASTVFRVRMDDLKPRTTYYYTVGAMESNGKDDGLKSEVKQFTTN